MCNEWLNELISYFKTHTSHAWWHVAKIPILENVQTIDSQYTPEDYNFASAPMDNTIKIYTPQRDALNSTINPINFNL